MTAQAEHTLAFSQTFDDDDALAGASIEGAVCISTEAPWKGRGCLLLEQPREQAERAPCSAAMPGFAVQPGYWDLAYAARVDVPSQDSSYNGTVWLEVFDAAGARIERKEVEIFCGSKPWKPSRQRIELDDDAASARFVFSIQKSHGRFAIDGLSAEYAGPSLRTVSAITFAAAEDVVGMLFLPEQPLRFTVATRNKKPRPAVQRVVSVSVRDFWGAEYLTRDVCLDTESTDNQGRLIYSGALDLRDFAPEIGRYYELHGSIAEPALDEPTRDCSSFAVLPLAVTKGYAPFDIPFTASCWNPDREGVFPLIDRLGLRVTNIYSRHERTPPYAVIEPPNIDQVEALGMGALIGCCMAAVERHAWDDVSEAEQLTALYHGTQNIVRHFRERFPIALRCGNEPHPHDDDDARRMIRGYEAVYKAVKDIDPAITVTATSCGAEEQFFRLGYQDFHDVYIFHDYSDAQTIAGDIDRYEALVATYGKRKPVWSTELGLNSQGMSRDAVASQMYKILAYFFAKGGRNASWFGIMWPDPDGKIVGSNGDSFDVFNSKYCLYSPKMTAISEYHMVNAICVKQPVALKEYASGETLAHFRDADGRNLVVAWRDAGSRCLRLALPQDTAIDLTRFDGAMKRYRAGDGALDLALCEDPMLLQFDGCDYQLPASLDDASVQPIGVWGPVVKGCEVELRLQAASAESAAAIELQLPPRWGCSTTVVDRDARFTLTAPADSEVRSCRLVALLGDAVGELLLPLPVEDALAVQVAPAVRDERGAGVQLQLRNRGNTPCAVEWQLAFLEQYPMDNGAFQLKSPVPFTADFIDPDGGLVRLQPGEALSIDARLANMDPLTLYRVRAQWSVDGRICSSERYLGGCVGVPKVSGGVQLDGRMSDANWRHAAVVHMDQPHQFCHLNRRTASWAGPEDLSATMHLMWDDEHLYIGMRVTDDVHSQPEINGKIWRGDGLQFLFDPCRGTSDKPGRYDYSAALTRLGPQAWCGSTADAARAPAGDVSEAFSAAIALTGEQGDMIYELAIPWHRISPFQAAPGANLGLGMIVNNDDGQIRDSFMAWFGCAHSKQLDMNGDLVLLDG